MRPDPSEPWMASEVKREQVPGIALAGHGTSIVVMDLDDFGAVCEVVREAGVQRG